MGGKARRIFVETDVLEFAVPESALGEVRRYISTAARKLGTRQEFLEYTLDLLPLTVYPQKASRRCLPAARLRIARRDPDEVDVLALCLSLNLPLWTNDRDFEGANVVSLTTAELLTLFFGKTKN